MTPNRVKPLCLVINRINGYIKEDNGNEYSSLVYTDESKDLLIKIKKREVKQIFLYQKVITQMNMMKNISQSNLV